MTGVALYNRVRSQSVTTKYLRLELNDGPANVEVDPIKWDLFEITKVDKECLESLLMTPFVDETNPILFQADEETRAWVQEAAMTIPQLEHHMYDDDELDTRDEIRYGDVVILKDPESGKSLRPFIMRKVESKMAVIREHGEPATTHSSLFLLFSSKG